jgi:hypothetical protein
MENNVLTFTIDAMEAFSVRDIAGFFSVGHLTRSQAGHAISTEAYYHRFQNHRQPQCHEVNIQGAKKKKTYLDSGFVSSR